MFLSNFESPPPMFVFAKWVCIAATATSPLLLVIATIKLNLGMFLFAFAAMLFVPFMAVCGYGISMLIRSVILTKQSESPKGFLPLEQGQRLFASARTHSAKGILKQFVTITDGQHNSIPNIQIQSAVKDLLERLE